MQEQKRIRLLNAEISHLEAPDRIERLGRQYLGMTPVDPRREIAPDGLAAAAKVVVPVVKP